MPTSLVDRCKQIIAAENDDYFRNETILYYINKSARSVVNYMVQQELKPTVSVGDRVVKGAERSLRALDSLRTTATNTLGTFTNQGDYFSGTQAVPNDLLQLLYLKYDGSTVLRELSSQKLYLLSHGNAIPTEYEGYFHITGTSIELYLYEDPNSAADLDVVYIKEPTEITDETATAFTDIAEQLENAILYRAAIMMITQESIETSSNAVELLRSIYLEEIENNRF